MAYFLIIYIGLFSNNIHGLFSNNIHGLIFLIIYVYGRSIFNIFSSQYITLRSKFKILNWLYQFLTSLHTKMIQHNSIFLVYPSIHPSVHLSINPPIHLSIYSSLHLSFAYVDRLQTRKLVYNLSQDRINNSVHSKIALLKQNII